jgi:hypothetical protein
MSSTRSGVITAFDEKNQRGVIDRRFKFTAHDAYGESFAWLAAGNAVDYEVDKNYAKRIRLPGFVLPDYYGLMGEGKWADACSMHVNTCVRLMFPDVEDSKRRELLFDRECLFSVTDSEAAAYTAQLAKGIVPAARIVVDATGCGGGNTIGFSKFFSQVISVEMNSKRAQFISNNVRVLGCENVEVVNGDYVELMSQLIQDIVFIDAPWGGREYKRSETIMLELSGVTLVDISIRLLDSCSLLILKVPFNFDFKSLESGAGFPIPRVECGKNTTLCFVSKLASADSISSILSSRKRKSPE